MSGFRFLLTASVATLALAPSAFAQSTGSLDFDESIVVTGSRSTDVGGIKVPDSAKAKVEIGEEMIARAAAGQTVNDILNLVPGVSFTNNDPWGSLGGSFTIRGFDSTRVSQTIDGVPLNDSGGYALYTNQQQDPETLASVSVNLGSTDVDSPTASAAGGTINIRSRDPADKFGAMASLSYGNVIARGNNDDRYMVRGFVMVDTGDITGMGTTAWFSASATQNKSTFANYGGVDKQQYNGKIRQDLGNDQYISIAAHYNENRNTFNGSSNSYANLGLSSGGLVLAAKDRFYNIGAPCTTDTPQGGVADTANNCGTEFERRYNPSNTGNIRISSLFRPVDGVTLTIEPSFQTVKANGGGTVLARESGRLIGGRMQYGFIGGQYYAGVDLNGDGDVRDTCSLTGASCSSSNLQGVRVLAPSQTNTRRYGVISNLSYEISPQHRVRLSYTFDRARHRQTGELGFLHADGEPFDVFPVNNPILDANGNVIQKRDRLSYATLHQVSGEYTGRFINDALKVQIGGRLPFHKRDLNQNCFTTSLSGFVDCIYGDANIAAYAAANPYSFNTTTNQASGYALPQSRKYSYNKFLPNVGFVYSFTPNVSFAFNYAKNLSVPGTDDFYNSLMIPAGNPLAKPVAETSDSFDASLRYTSSKVQAQITGWHTMYKNRLASVYNIDCDCTLTSNLGKVEKYGIDANVSVRPVEPLLLYVWGSWIHSEIKSDIAGGLCNTANIALGYCSTAGQQFNFPTAGKRERNTPDYMIGARAQLTLGGFDLGAQVKRTGKRFLTDTNFPVFALPAYTVADLDVRYSLQNLTGLNKAYFQLNLNNLFDEVYIGSASGGVALPSNNFVNIGSPRSIMGSLVFGF